MLIRRNRWPHASYGIKINHNPVKWPYILRIIGFVVSSVVQVYDGCTRPGDASAWRAEGQRVEDHQRAPGLRR